MKKTLLFLSLCLVQAALADTVMVTGNRVNLRAAPHGHSEVVGQVSYDDRLTLHGAPTDVWVKVGIPPTCDVWIFSELLRNDLVIADKAQVRAGAGLNYHAVGQLVRGDRVEIRGTFKEWTKIAPPANCSVFITNLYVRVLTPEEAAQPGSATPAAPAIEAPAAPAASAVETSVAPAPAAPAAPAASAVETSAAPAPAAPAAPAPEAAPVAETPAPAPVPEQPIVYAYDSVVPAPKAETPPAAPAAPAASETAAVPPPEPTNAVTSVATIPADTPETETASKMESSATATPAYPASLSSPTRRTLLGNRASDERIGPAKIPAARLRSQSEQAQPGVYSGTLASSPLFGSHPTKFRLVTKNRDNRETTVAYVYGNSGQLTSFLGETLTISGAIYWFRDTELPTVFAQDILRGKSGSAAAR